MAKCHQEAKSNRCKHAQVWKTRAVIVRRHSLYSSATLSLAVGSCTWPAVCSLYAACTCRLAFSAQSGMHVNMLQPDCIRPVQAEACLEQSLDCKSNTAATNQHQALLPNAQMIVYGMHPETGKRRLCPETKQLLMLQPTCCGYIMCEYNFTDCEFLQTTFGGCLHLVCSHTVWHCLHVCHCLSVCPCLHVCHYLCVLPCLHVHHPLYICDDPHTTEAVKHPTEDADLLKLPRKA